MNPLDALKHFPDEVKTFVVNAISNAKVEAKIEALNLVLAAEQAEAEAAQQFLEDRIAELRGQIRPL